MITKQDCMLLLMNLLEKGIDTNKELKQLVNSDNVSLEVLKFINDNRLLDLAKFYEKIRKSYNDKKSILYKNLMLEFNEDNMNEVLTTLNSYALQITLFSKDIEDKQMFFNFARLNEIYKCLEHYTNTYELYPCILLLKLIKADIKVLETIYR